MNVFEQEICKITCKALNDLGDAEDWVPSKLQILLEKPPNPEMGDYALPCFNFAKKLRTPPVKISEKLVNQIQKYVKSNNLINSIEVAGAYINFFISVVTLAEFILPEIFSGRYFKTPSRKSLERVMQTIRRYFC